MKKILFWFRRDLRWEDNHGLYQACKEGNEVFPIFIFDTNILEKIKNTNDHRITFIHQTLQRINKEFQKHTSTLIVRHGDPQEIILNFCTQHKIDSVYTNRDYEPYARLRDNKIQKTLSKHKINFTTYKDHVVFEPGEVIKDNGSPYTVYTPYRNKWHKLFVTNMIKNYPSEKNLTHLAKIPSTEILSLKQLGFKKSCINVKPNIFTSHMFLNYTNARDFPAEEVGTSNVSPYLRFGQISIREVYRKSLQYKNDTFTNELIWREFFLQLLWFFPNSKRKSIKPAYEKINWSKDKKKFKKWCEGKTGYPIVDAGMRELNTTGYMHNRVRMVTASFLCKHLQIDWKWGEQYFAEKLFDYEMASNVGNWQWVAGSGADTMPYFRIFNPLTQQKKFDPKNIYIKKWVPEFDTKGYVQEIVEHKKARLKTLNMYQKALNKKPDSKTLLKNKSII